MGTKRTPAYSCLETELCRFNLASHLRVLCCNQVEVRVESLNLISKAIRPSPYVVLRYDRHWVRLPTSNYQCNINYDRSFTFGVRCLELWPRGAVKTDIPRKLRFFACKCCTSCVCVQNAYCAALRRSFLVDVPAGHGHGSFLHFGEGLGKVRVPVFRNEPPNSLAKIDCAKRGIRCTEDLFLWDTVAISRICTRSERNGQ